ncbi:MAG: hypothetical protein ACYDH6_09875 [Acidimicrobiales bacterium]
MVVVYVVLSVAVVLFVAAVAIGREARRLDAEPPRAVFDLDEATEWVANHLPLEVSAVLSFAEVRQILEWNIEFLQTKGLASSPTLPSAVVIGPEEVADYVLNRARGLDSPWSEDQVAAVLDAQFGYFDAIGAIGPTASPDDLEN